MRRLAKYSPIDKIYTGGTSYGGVGWAEISKNGVHGAPLVLRREVEFVCGATTVGVVGIQS